MYKTQLVLESGNEILPSKGTLAVIDTAEQEDDGGDRHSRARARESENPSDPRSENNY